MALFSLRTAAPPHPGRWLGSLLMLLLLPLLGWGQTTIFSVNGGGPLPTNWVGTNNVTTNAIDQGSYYLLDAGSPSDLITTDVYDLSAYSSLTFTVDVATFGSATGNNPAKIEISTAATPSYSTAGTSVTPTSSTYVTTTSITINGPFTTTTRLRFSNNGATGRGVRLQNIKLVGNGAVGTAPTVTTGAATATSSTAGTVGGTVTAAGSTAVTSEGAYYSTTAGQVATTGGTQVSSGSTATPFTTTLTSLASNTLYYVAAYATNNTGTSRGSEASFTTRPAVTSAAASAITATTATANASIAAGGAATITDRGVYISTTAGQVATGGGTKTPAATLSGTGSYTVALSGLTPGTVYYVAGYATNAGGTSYGTEVSFTTASPTITTGNPTPVPVCATSAATISVPFTSNVTPTGTYTVQLSDANGNFTTPTNLATTGTATPLTATIPAGTASGTGYKVRVNNTAPAITGSANATAFIIVSNPTVTISPNTAQTTTTGSTITFTATETPAATSRQWMYGTTSGGPYSTNGGTGTTYAFTPTAAGTYYVVVTSTFAACGSVTSAETQVTVTNPVPTLTSINPNSTAAGSAAFTLTATGTNFVSGATLTFGSTTVATTGSGTTLTATIPAAAVTTAGTYNVTVTNPAPGGGTSAAVTFTVNAPPLLAYNFTTNTNPSTQAANVTGSTFVASADLTVANTTPDFRYSNYTSSATAVPDKTQDYYEFTATAASGYSLNLTNLTLTDRRSGTGPTNYVLRSSLDNYSANIGAVQTIDAAPGFTNTKNISFSGTSALSAVTGAVTFHLYAYNASGSGGTFAVDDVMLYGTLTVATNPVPTLTSIAPTSAFAGDAGFTLTATGTGFVSTSVINFNGTPLTTTYVSGTSLTAAVPAAAIATAGSYPVTVTSPTPGGGTSGSVTFTVNPATAPTVTTTSPATAITSSGATLSGNVSSFGGPVGSTPAYGFVYSLTSDNPTPTLGDPTSTTIVRGTTATTGSYSSVLTGLSSSTSYSFRAYATNSAGTTYGSVVTFTTTAPPAATTYTWTGATSASWSVATNWNPTRTTPATSDILIFNGSTVASPTVTVDFTTSQTIGQLRFINNVTATLNTAGNRTLTIDNNLTGDDFVVGAGSAVTVALTSGASSGVGLAIKLTSTETAAISGSLTFDGNTVTGATGENSLQGAAANAIQFLSGSIFTAGNYVDGSSGFAVLGTTTVNSVVFNNGARYNQLGGSSPFYLTQPSAIVVFQPASYYYFALTGGTPANSGRTYGTLEFNSSSNSDLTSAAAPFTVQGDLLVTSGTVSINSAAGFMLKGNLTVRGTGKLNLFNSATGTVQLTGTTLQTISNTSSTASALTFGTNATLQVNNAAGVTLATPITLPGVLQLTSGIVNTTATNLLTVTSAGSVTASTNITATSYINGPFARVSGTGARTLLFPIGSTTAYRPLTLTSTAQTTSVTYTATQTEASAGGTTGLSTNNGADTTPLTRVSKVRYQTITTTSNSSGFNGTVTLSFGPDDFVNQPSKVVVAKRDAVATAPGVAPADNNKWVNLYRTSSTGADNGPGGNPVTGTVTSTAFTSFSDFALGATNTNTNTTSDINPLPVELTTFGAHRSGTAVAVTWTTASEKNSEKFVVERSFDGQTFAPVATVVAAGTSLTPRSYLSTDATAPSVTLYYRLQQVDFDGTAAYSEVVAVAGTAAELSLAPNPARESVQLFAGQGATYTLRSMLGQVVRTGTTEAGTTTISLTGLPTGVYTVELTTATSRVVRKLTKE